MAKDNTAKVESVKQTKTVQEPTYTVDEFTSAPETLKANADIVKAALLMGGKQSYTIQEAKEIVNKFKGKEVM